MNIFNVEGSSLRPQGRYVNETGGYFNVQAFRRIPDSWVAVCITQNALLLKAESYTRNVQMTVKWNNRS